MCSVAQRASRTHTSSAQRVRARHVCRATSALVPWTPGSSSDPHGALLEELSAFLKQDLPHLFDDQGIDQTRYEPTMEFTDPLTRYDNLSGYLFNIQMLRRVFSPSFTLHSVLRTGPLQLSTRWTMGMRVTTPLSFAWSPELLFTGVSIMDVNPSGKFCRHVDLWDSIDNNAYLSGEAVADLLKQLTALQRTPELATPAFVTLLRRADYAVRRYDAFLVARTQLPASTGAAGDGGGFGTLARYLFGGNQQRVSMSMTTPVLNRVSDDSGRSTEMAFPVIERNMGSQSELPLPIERTVERAGVPARVLAVACFSGVESDADAQREAGKLRRALERDGLRTCSGYELARYNDPTTLGPFRRNEVLIELKDFTLV